MGRGGCQLQRAQEKRCRCFICRFCRSLRSPQNTAPQEPGHRGRVCGGRGRRRGWWWSWWCGGPRRPEDALYDGSQANPPELDQAEDLASLVSVNESSVLNTLLQRYRAQLPHTRAGPDLIFLQPQGLLAPSAGKVRGPRGRGPSASQWEQSPQSPWKRVCEQRPADVGAGASEPRGASGTTCSSFFRGGDDRYKQQQERETGTVGENVLDGVRSVRLCFGQLGVSSQPVLRPMRGRGQD